MKQSFPNIAGKHILIIVENLPVPFDQKGLAGGYNSQGGRGRNKYYLPKDE